MKLKEIAHEQHVLEARKKQSQNTKRKKQQLQQKKENELNTIKWNVKLMGGLVRSSKDIDNLIIKSCKSIRSKKEKLRYQILRYNIVNIL